MTENYSLVNRLVAGDDSAIIEVIEAYIPLARKIAKKFKIYHVPFDEVFAESQYQLTLAVHNFYQLEDKVAQALPAYIRKAIYRSVNDFCSSYSLVNRSRASIRMSKRYNPTKEQKMPVMVFDSSDQLTMLTHPEGLDLIQESHSSEELKGYFKEAKLDEFETKVAYLVFTLGSHRLAHIKLGISRPYIYYVMDRVLKKLRGHFK